MLSRAIVFVAVLGVAHYVDAQPLVISRTDYPSTAGARAMATADFDRNGWPDLAQANFGRNSVTVLLNRVGGREGLAPFVEVPVGQGPFDMTSADFDLDGVIDLAVANADANTLSILLGHGDGRFTRTDIAAPGSPRGIVAADMNRDGKPDLVYTAFNANRVQTLIGNGSGGFVAGFSLPGSAPRPQGIAAADFNKDGTLDLAVAYASTGGGLVILSIDRAGRPTARAVAGPHNLNLVTTGDFNEDGWLDVASASTGNNALEMFWGGSSGLQHAATHATGASPRGLRAADLNHDGRLDLVTANRDASTLTVFTGRPGAPGSFDSVELAAGRGSRDVVAADFNHDGRLDLATGNQDAATVSVMFNETDFVRAAYVLSSEQIPSDGNAGSSPIVEDLNHNGIPDLATDGYVLIDRTSVRALPPNSWLHAVADLNADGHLDLVTSEPESPARVWANDGRGNFTPDAVLPVPAVVQSIDLADMNSDGRLDLIVSTYSWTTTVGTIEVLLRRADGTWASASRTTVPSWTLGLHFADLNLDGHLDVLTTYYRPARMDVFVGDGAGGLAPAGSYPLEDYGFGIATGDINHDGAIDVVVGAWEHVSLFLGSRSGELMPEAVISIEGFYPKLADMNMDGHLDLIAGWTSILAGAGDGRFSGPETFDTGAFHTAVADFNSDGLPDLVSDNVVIYNERNATNRPPTVTIQEDFAIDYNWQYGDEDFEISVEAGDSDLHALTYEWTNEAGEVIATYRWLQLRLPPGTHRLRLTVGDNRGGSATDDVVITIRPNPEVVIRNNSPSGWYYSNGSWEIVEDPTAADGYRAHDPNLGAPKLQAPRANPTDYLGVGFIADPTQTYKLWLRGKADGNNWANDSVWLQFSGATNVSGTPVYRIGTTSGLDVNLEECAGCGLAGWGWRDERWGPALTSQPVLLRFPEGGVQQLLIQSREDGLSIDQIVLSAETYLNRAPGPAKNDMTIVPPGAARRGSERRSRSPVASTWVPHRAGPRRDYNAKASGDPLTL